MLLALATVLFAALYAVYVPKWGKATEEEHLRAVRQGFALMADNLASLATAEPGESVSTRVEMGKPGDPVFGTGGTRGSLSFLPEEGLVVVHNPEDPEEVYGRSRGVVRYASVNQYFPNQEISLEGSGVIARQGSTSTVAHRPILTASVYESSVHTYDFRSETSQTRSPSYEDFFAVKPSPPNTYAVSPEEALTFDMYPAVMGSIFAREVPTPAPLSPASAGWRADADFSILLMDQLASSDRLVVFYIGDDRQDEADPTTRSVWDGSRSAIAVAAVPIGPTSYTLQVQYRDNASSIWLLPGFGGHAYRIYDEVHLTVRYSPPLVTVSAGNRTDPLIEQDSLDAQGTAGFLFKHIGLASTMRSGADSAAHGQGWIDNVTFTTRSSGLSLTLFTLSGRERYTSGRGHREVWGTLLARSVNLYDPSHGLSKVRVNVTTATPQAWKTFFNATMGTLLGSYGLYDLSCGNIAGSNLWWVAADIFEVRSLSLTILVIGVDVR